MASVLYEFDTIVHGEQKNSIFQFVKGRKLTNVYHSHDFYELVCFLRGRGKQIVNDEEILAEEKTVMLFCPGDEHCFVEQSEDIEIISLSVRREHFELVASTYGLFFEQHPHTFTFPRVSKLYDIYRENNIASESDCVMLLSTLLHAYIHSKDQFSHSSLPSELLGAVDEMKESENLKMGIPAFLSLSNYSQSHLARLMKLHFGMGLKAYINEQRLLRAYDELILTNESAEVISENLGFSSYSHFCKIFKDKFSVSPSSLRKGCKNKKVETMRITNGIIQGREVCYNKDNTQN